MRLNDVLRYLKVYYKGVDGVEKTIINCAITAAGASAVGGFFPVLAIPATIVSCFGAVWTMYVSLCKQLEIPIGENILKVLASAALTNLTMNLLGSIAIELVAAFIPGVGSVASAAITFASVYLAGMMFMNMLLALAKKGKVGADLNNMSQDDLKHHMQQQTPTKEDLKDAKVAFNSNYSR